MVRPTDGKIDLVTMRRPMGKILARSVSEKARKLQIGINYLSLIYPYQ
jgi:hypothetical protein